MERVLFGEDGFENIVKKVAALEKELNIYKLDQFTPVLPFAYKQQASK
jgi:hypothetical protein